MLPSEVVKTEISKVMAVSRIRKRIGTGEMWNADLNCRTVAGNAVDLFHRSNNVVQMLDDVQRNHRSKFVVREWPRLPVQIPHDIRRSCRRHIYVDRILEMLVSTTQVKLILHPVKGDDCRRY